MRIGSPKCRDSRGSRISLLARILAATAAVVMLFAMPSFAEHTRWWRQTTYEEFDKGTAKGVSLRSDGKLFLAPRFAEFADANLAYLLTLHADSKGNLYAGGGSNAKVLRLDATGKHTTVFESSELAAQALALDSTGNLYVGTSPDGKVYKVTPAGQSSVFFDPKTKYIWDLAVDKDGTLFVATGDTGKIFAVAPNGNGQVFYSSEETHIRALAFDSNGNVLAGTEPSGIILRIPKAADPALQRAAAARPGDSAANVRRAFVLYETSKKEITALMPDGIGNLYVAAVGEKTPPGQLRPQGTDLGTAGGFTITVGGANQAAPAQQNQPLISPLPLVVSSSVYRIASDGSPEELWGSRDDVVYALGLLPNGKLLLGTGNQGAVLEVESNRTFSRLLKTASGQVTAIATGPGGKLFLAAANPGKLFTLGPDNEPEGTFESQPFDAHIFSRWGQVQWLNQGVTSGSNASRARIEFYARSGNTSDPQNNWSPWAGPYSSSSSGKLDCPPARFVQWKAVMHGAAGGPTPELDWVSVAYLPKNVAPVVTGIAIQSPGVRAQAISLPGPGGGAQTPVQLRMPAPATPPSQVGSAFVAAASANPSSSSPRFDVVPQGFSQKGFQSVVWNADDANEDQLEFAIYFRGENETTWKLLKDKIDVRFYSWDTTTMPDGAYYLKIVASDAPANPAGEGLTSERESDRFEVDNTPPAIAQLTAEPTGAGGTVRVRFQASDPASSIARAQYSVDAGDWILVFPTGGLSDAVREGYDFQMQKIPAGEHSVTIRVYDQFENVSSAKTTVRVPASAGN